MVAANFSKGQAGSETPAQELPPDMDLGTVQRKTGPHLDQAIRNYIIMFYSGGLPKNTSS
jgi:hypothetical protein